MARKQMIIADFKDKVFDYENKERVGIKRRETRDY